MQTRVELLRYALITHITCTGIHLAALAAALGIWTAEFQTADPYAETSTAPTTISRDMAEANMHAYERRLAAGVALPTVGAWFVVCAVVSGVAAVFVRERLVLLHGRRVDPRWRELFRVRK